MLSFLHVICRITLETVNPIDTPECGYEIVHMENIKGSPNVRTFRAVTTRNDMTPASGYSTKQIKTFASEGDKCVEKWTYQSNLYHSLHKYNTTHDLLIDSFDYCIIIRSRVDKSTDVFAGVCSTKGYQDGPGHHAKFSTVYHSVKHPSLNSLIISDHDNQCLRSLDLGAAHVSTHKRLLVKPLGLALHTATNTLFFSYRKRYDGGGIGKISRIDGQVEYISGTDNNPGHNDGNLINAKFSSLPLSIAFVAEAVLLVTDYNNHVVRVVDINQNSVSTLCRPGTPSGGGVPIDQCELKSPQSLLAQPDRSRILVGMHGSIAAIYFKGKA